jgi:hypothetical protein
MATAALQGTSCRMCPLSGHHHHNYGLWSQSRFRFCLVHSRSRSQSMSASARLCLVSQGTRVANDTASGLSHMLSPVSLCRSLRRRSHASYTGAVTRIRLKRPRSSASWVLAAGRALPRLRAECQPSHVIKSFGSPAAVPEYVRACKWVHMFASLAQAVAGDEYSDEEVTPCCISDTVTIFVMACQERVRTHIPRA